MFMTDLHFTRFHFVTLPKYLWPQNMLKVPEKQPKLENASQIQTKYSRVNESKK